MSGFYSVCFRGYPVRGWGGVILAFVCELVVMVIRIDNFGGEGLSI